MISKLRRFLFATTATLFLVFASSAFAQTPRKTSPCYLIPSRSRCSWSQADVATTTIFRRNLCNSLQKTGDSPIQWTVVNEGGQRNESNDFAWYKNPKWAEGFDVVIHNECFADTDDPDYIRSITKPHFDGVNAIVIHCAMHTYRSAKVDDWREFLGVTSRRHDHQSNYPVSVAKRITRS
jgi:hypothetical protein